MRVTTNGQVTIPRYIREKLGITPATEVDFVEKEGRIFLVTGNPCAVKEYKSRFDGIQELVHVTIEMNACQYI